MQKQYNSYCGIRIKKFISVVLAGLLSARAGGFGLVYLYALSWWSKARKETVFVFSSTVNFKTKLLSMWTLRSPARTLPRGL
jgi:hypothetical protein